MVQPLRAAEFKGQQCGRQNKYDRRKDANFVLNFFKLLGQNTRKFIKEWRLFEVHNLSGAAIVIIRPWHQKQPSYATVTVYRLLPVNLSGHETT